MPKVIDQIAVCADCFQPIVNGDFTALDYWYSPEEADKREAEIKQGMSNLDGTPVIGGGELDTPYSSLPCECCGSKLHGGRYTIDIID